MAVERKEYDEDQWAEFEMRPTHGTVRQIAKEVQRIQRGTDPMEAEDVLVQKLVKAWHIKDEDGNELPLQKASFQNVPQDIWGRIIDDCSAILESNIPNPTTRAF